MLGCLFILIFGFIFLVIGVGNAIFRLLFGGVSSQRRQATNTYQRRSSAEQEFHSSTHAGNAHHEGSRKNSRQRRSGKIFAQDEGTYVDFEEIK